jgi:predicted nucleic acid-binding protein
MLEIISNSSCIITLDNIGMLSILKELYGNIRITEEVYQEFGKPLENWIKAEKVRNRDFIRILNNLVDIGEASTIAFSFEVQNSLMILDDLRARKVAENLKLKFTGLLGVLLKAKQNNILSSVRDVLSKIKAANFRISSAMENKVLRLAGEI